MAIFKKLLRNVIGHGLLASTFFFDLSERLSASVQRKVKLKLFIARLPSAQKIKIPQFVSLTTLVDCGING